MINFRENPTNQSIIAEIEMSKFDIQGFVAEKVANKIADELSDDANFKALIQTGVSADAIIQKSLEKVADIMVKILKDKLEK